MRTFRTGSAVASNVYEQAVLEWARTMPEPACCPSHGDEFLGADGEPLDCLSNRVMRDMRERAQVDNAIHARALVAALRYARRVSPDDVPRLRRLVAEKWQAWIDERDTR